MLNQNPYRAEDYLLNLAYNIHNTWHIETQIFDSTTIESQRNYASFASQVNTISSIDLSHYDSNQISFILDKYKRTIDIMIDREIRKNLELCDVLQIDSKNLYTFLSSFIYEGIYQFLSKYPQIREPKGTIVLPYETFIDFSTTYNEYMMRTIKDTLPLDRLYAHVINYFNEKEQTPYFYIYDPSLVHCFLTTKNKALAFGVVVKQKCGIAVNIYNHYEQNFETLLKLNRAKQIALNPREEFSILL